MNRNSLLGLKISVRLCHPPMWFKYYICGHCSNREEGAVIDGSREGECGALRDGNVAAEFARGSSCLRPEKLSQETPPPTLLTPRPPASQATAALGQRHPRKARSGCSSRSEEAATQWKAEPCHPPPSRLKTLSCSPLPSG